MTDSTVVDTLPGAIAVVGNPNVGKSTLFNALTGGRQRVANYAGVTVDAREAELEGGQRIIDLPGTYSLKPRAADEAVVETVLSSKDDAPATILVVVDATNLRRNLFLLSEVLDLGVPVVVALNMVDEALRSGASVPTDLLRTALGVPVVETVAVTGAGCAELLAALKTATTSERAWTFADKPLEETFAAKTGSAWERLKAMEAEDGSVREKVIAARYGWITEVLTEGHSPGARARSDRFDAVLLHPVAGPLFFLTIMALVFQSIFTWAGPLMDVIDAGVGATQGWCMARLPALIGPLGTDLVANGVVAGVGAVVIFVPQIAILFLLLGLLEDTGYMARAAFLVDRPLRAVGLSGRSFIPLLSSFACAVPGVMATRTIPGRFERMLAIFLAPLMTCSARLPVYALLIAAFIPTTSVMGVFNLQGLVLLGLYLAGVCSAIVIAFLASRRTPIRGRALPMVVELPPYRRPTARGVFLKLKVRVGDFLKRAGTVVFLVSVVLWFLMAFPRAEITPTLSDDEQAAVQLRESYAGQLGHAIEPLIRPLGYDWKMGVGLIASFAAREVFVSTMGIVYSIGGDVDEENEGLQAALKAETREGTDQKAFSLATVCSLLMFYVFALQCGATIAIVKRETSSWRFALGQLVAYLVMAYVAALVTYQSLAACGYA